MILDASRYVMDLEQEYRLFEQKLGGVYFWKLIRFSLARRIEIKRGSLESSKNLDIEKPVLKQVMRFFRSFDHCYKKPKAILYEHSRKVKYRNSFIDPYSWRVTQTLENAQIDFCLLENDMYYQCDSWDPRRWFLYSGHLKRVQFKRLERLPGEISQLICALEQKILSDLGQQIDMASLVLTSVNNFKKNYAYFSNTLRNKSPEVLFVVCGYGKEGIVQAAKDAGIYTVELQHGTIYSLHMGYSYPGWENIPYFCDSIALYSDAWLETIPLRGVDIRVLGYAPAKNAVASESNEEKGIDILFISQWVYSEKILQFADKAAQMMPNKTVVCKLHPSDTVDADAARRYPHIKIEKTGLLEQYLRAAEYAVTVFSTGIFEGLRYGCRPILLNMYGIQYMRDFIDVTGAPVVSEPTELVDFISNHDSASLYRNLNYKYWFEDFNESVILEYIKNSAVCKSRNDR